MKQIFILALAAITFSGCFSKINKSVINAATEATDGDAPFVITANGEKIKGIIAKIIVRGKNASNVNLDDKIYLQKDLTAVQTKDAYFTNFGNYWWRRVHKGRIEAYTYTYTNGKTMTTICKMRKDMGELKQYTTNNLLELISDSKSTVALFNETFKKANDKTPWDFNYKNLRLVLGDYK